MVEADIIKLTTEALLLVLMLSLPPIIVASVVGTLVSLFQALTQIQEQTLSFAIKLITVTLTLYFTADWVGSELYYYTQRIFNYLPTLARN
ncbi:type III secretion system export apparatus subunit SctS [Thalassomonas haliotis]|uniref:Type III secretion system export apparatus subunit SctS n=1 Tax=Thalassomonas haliotis TaxID=485448 RepID=A0ABY7V751_9GAMM|nr:type III secretion system export apparatus subunit SctS [Thalassomonas haliotis]WDE09451.1 type III secretion system export apparatus subunit SctS [Thalassomonas haliotis]